MVHREEVALRPHKPAAWKDCILLSLVEVLVGGRLRLGAQDCTHTSAAADTSTDMDERTLALAIPIRPILPLILSLPLTRLPLARLLLMVSILHVAIAVLWAARAVPLATVTAVVVPLAVSARLAVVLVTRAARWRRGGATATSACRGALAAWWTAGIEAPAC